VARRYDSARWGTPELAPRFFGASSISSSSLESLSSVEFQSSSQESSASFSLKMGSSGAAGRHAPSTPERLKALAEEAEERVRLGTGAGGGGRGGAYVQSVRTCKRSSFTLRIASAFCCRVRASDVDMGTWVRGFVGFVGFVGSAGFVGCRERGGQEMRRNRVNRREHRGKGVSKE